MTCRKCGCKDTYLSINADVVVGLCKKCYGEWYKIINSTNLPTELETRRERWLIAWKEFISDSPEKVVFT